MTHDATQTRRIFFCGGNWTDERIKGIVGSKNRASWCWNMDSTDMPEIAEYSLKEKCGRVNKRIAAGPMSCGKLNRLCWYHGCSPCCARFDGEILYRRLLIGVTTGFVNKSFHEIW